MRVSCVNCRTAIDDRETICATCGVSRGSKWAQASRAKLYTRARTYVSWLRGFAALGATVMVVTFGIGTWVSLSGGPNAAGGIAVVTAALYAGLFTVVCGGAAVALELLTEQTARVCGPHAAEGQGESDRPSGAAGQEGEPRAELGSFID